MNRFPFFGTMTRKRNMFLALAAGLVLSTVARVDAQSCVSLPQGIVSWWPGQYTANAVAGVNDGSLLGGVAFTPGVVNQGFSLNGVHQFVQVLSQALWLDLTHSRKREI